MRRHYHKSHPLRHRQALLYHLRQVLLSRLQPKAALPHLHFHLPVLYCLRPGTGPVYLLRCNLQGKTDPAYHPLQRFLHRKTVPVRPLHCSLPEKYPQDSGPRQSPADQGPDPRQSPADHSPGLRQSPADQGPDPRQSPV